MESGKREVVVDADAANLAVLVPGVALLDRPEYGFLQFFESLVVGITHALQLSVQLVERLNRPFVRDFPQRHRDFSEQDPIRIRFLEDL